MLAMANWLRNLQWHSDDIEMTRTIHIYAAVVSLLLFITNSNRI